MHASHTLVVLYFAAQATFNMHIMSAMENTILPNYYGIIVQDENNNGGYDYKTCKVNNFDQTMYRYIPCIENASFNDLGQENCMYDFEKKFKVIHQDFFHESYEASIKKNNLHKKYIAYAIGQGASTLINWLAGKPYHEQNSVVACLFLESIITSGDDQITSAAKRHEMENKIPSLRAPYIMPTLDSMASWAEKTLRYPAYMPTGKQAGLSAKNISPDIPIIIMHNKTDPISINGPRELYCTLKKNGNQNVYLFEIESEYPLNSSILSYDNNAHYKARALQLIYKKHGLPFDNAFLQGYQGSIDITQFQPSPEEVRRRIGNER